ncbi:VWA domain-containing protein [Brevibacillus composti]|uniref:VWA domain-containing protein n=1 Tax=Brevibacillus composti TaxID=2796470 RepID=A0A7T5EL21_9BACL|nr:VWA domain-containing protein [Brevibacillus composti]QQE74576.1 VWA domain-containing protein [Brevibacillus composti]QUO41659.1 VWA domain-containing protein [Brevibacillus composti]
MKEATLRQILVVTDGCSNSGLSPVAAATLAREQGITVNVIGVIEKGDMGEQGTKEIREMAEAGGGLFDIVYPQQLAQTVQMLTRQAMTRTIHQVVSKELKEILGDSAMEGLAPEKRVQVAGMVDELGENSRLDVVMLVDSSGSMKPKLSAVQQAIHDFSISLRSRRGKSRMAVCSFPGKQTHLDVRIPWTEEVEQAHQLSSDLQMSGITPTGPAIVEAIALFDHVRLPANLQDRYGYDEKEDRGDLRDHVF